MSALAAVAGGVFDHLLVDIGKASAKHLDHYVRLVYRAHAEGHLDELRAGQLHQAAEMRRAVFAARRRCSEHARPSPPKLRPPENDRAKMQRKQRIWTCSGALPHQLRCHFTPGENAVAGIIRAEVRRHGCCSLSYRQIAKAAGLEGTTVVKRFVREAKRLGLIDVRVRPVRGQINETNIITIVSVEWKNWNALADGIGGTKVPAYQNQALKLLSNRRAGVRVERPQGAYEDESAPAMAVHRMRRRI